MFMLSTQSTEMDPLLIDPIITIIIIINNKNFITIVIVIMMSDKKVRKCPAEVDIGGVQKRHARTEWTDCWTNTTCFIIIKILAVKKPSSETVCNILNVQPPQRY